MGGPAQDCIDTFSRQPNTESFLPILASRCLKSNEVRIPMPAWYRRILRGLPFRTELFDYVLCTRVLSNVPTIGRLLSEFRRVAKPNAEIFISDVHPEHRYSELTISNGGKEIAIQIFKHSVEELKTAFAIASLQLVSFQEFRFQDLIWRPPIEKFRKIYEQPDRGIFYTCILRRP